MTDEQHLELSRKLALAFGWPDDKVKIYRSLQVLIETRYPWPYFDFTEFDYRDPVIAMAAIKRFGLNVFADSKNVWLRNRAMAGHSFKHCSLELAVAACVIEARAKGLV